MIINNVTLYGLIINDFFNVIYFALWLRKSAITKCWGEKNQNKQQISLLTSNELHDLNIYLKQTMLDVNNKPVFSFSKTNKQKYILLQI